MSPTAHHVFKGEKRLCAHFPLGGIGTGNVSLSADGSLRQWQLVNAVDHKAHVPSSFFFIHWKEPGHQQGMFKVLESSIEPAPGFVPAPAVNDHVVPRDVAERHRHLPVVDGTVMEAFYPVATLSYHDGALPVDLSVEAWTPMIPLDVQRSAMPVAIFTFSVRNKSIKDVHLSIGATLLNFIGWDGMTRINTTFFPPFVANVNELVNAPGMAGIHARTANPVIDHRYRGDVSLVSLHGGTVTIPDVGTTSDLVALLDDPGFRSRRFTTTGASEAGKTWLGAVVSPLDIPAGATTTVTFMLAWHFPGRVVNYDKTLHERVLPPEEAKQEFFLGNRYATWWTSSKDVITHASGELPYLATRTRMFRDALLATTLPAGISFSVSATMSFLRSPSCFITGNGEFHGFEGCRGESTGGGKGGCCPMDCTHVWNYVLTVSRLFPSLELSMRETEYGRVSEDGCLPHRIVLPSHLPQAWTVAIGGPAYPALDGLLGCVLKTWREARTTGDRAWLVARAGVVMQLMNHVFEYYDEDARGWIEEPQGNTYDIEFHGKTTYIGLLYLAALRAAAFITEITGDEAFMATCLTRYERGVTAYEDAWNGEYYEQVYDETRFTRNQYGKGCLSDQLFGQWWADVLGMGDIFPTDRLHAALGAIVGHNLGTSFAGFEQKPRVYVKDDETALHVCTWPRGGKPGHPVMYGDEAGWTGIEYEVAGLLIARGLWEEAQEILRAVRSRHDGTCRNPWNEVECGDHYVRAMSSWAMLELGSGVSWDGLNKTLIIAPPAGVELPLTSFFIMGTGWGTFTLGTTSLDIILLHGALAVSRLRVSLACDDMMGVTVDGEPVTNVVQEGNGSRLLTFRFDPALVVDGSRRVSVSGC